MNPETPQTHLLDSPDNPTTGSVFEPHPFAPKTPRSNWCRVCDQKWWREVHKDQPAPINPFHPAANRCPTCGAAKHNDPPDYDCPEQ